MEKEHVTLHGVGATRPAPDPQLQPEKQGLNTLGEDDFDAWLAQRSAPRTHDPEADTISSSEDEDRVTQRADMQTHATKSGAPRRTGTKLHPRLIVVAFLSFALMAAAVALIVAIYLRRKWDAERPVAIPIPAEPNTPRFDPPPPTTVEPPAAVAEPVASEAPAPTETMTVPPPEASKPKGITARGVPTTRPKSTAPAPTTTQISKFGVLKGDRE